MTTSTTTIGPTAPRRKVGRDGVGAHVVVSLVPHPCVLGVGGGQTLPWQCWVGCGILG